MPVIANAGVKPEHWACSGLCGAGFSSGMAEKSLVVFPVAEDPL